MVGVAQLARAPDCGSGGRGFKSHHPPQLFINAGRPAFSAVSNALALQAIGLWLLRQRKHRQQECDGCVAVVIMRP